MKKTALTAHIHTIRQIWRAIDVEPCGFKPWMLGLHHNAELQVSRFLQPRLPLTTTTTTFSIFRATTYFFHQHFRSLIDDDD